MMAPGAKGKQAGDVYVGPTWSEGLASGISKGMGVYDMAKSRQGQASLKQAKADQAQGRGVIGAHDRQQTADQQATSNQFKQVTQDQGQQRIDNTLSQQDKASLAAANKEAARIKERETDYQRDLDAGNLSHTQAVALEKLKQNGRRELEQLKADLEGGGIIDIEGLNPVDLKALDALPAGERKYARQSLSTIRELNKAAEAAYAVLDADGSFTGGEDVVTGLAEWIVPRPLENAARSGARRLVYDDKERNVKGLITNGAEAFKRARTGANLTQPETVLGENWDPGAPGISDQEALDRTFNIINFLNDGLGDVGLQKRDVYSHTLPEAPEPNDIPPSLSITDLTPEMIDTMSDEELKAYGF
jgi:hypothetical protein